MASTYEAHDRSWTRNRLLAVIAAVVVIAFLKWASAVLMPLAFGLFLALLVWPLGRWLEHRVPRWLALTLTILALLAGFGAFVGLLGWVGSRAASEGAQYAAVLEQTVSQARGWLVDRGLPVPVPRLEEIAGGGNLRQLGERLLTILSASVLVAAFTVLALGEADAFRRRLDRAFDDRKASRIADVVDSIATKFQRFLFAQLLIGLISGVLVGVYCLLLGVDLALLWGLLTMLLDLVPTLGSIIAIIPPTLFALVQFDGFLMPAAVFAGVSVIQIVMGNVVAPKIEGRYVSLSPLLVLVAIVFWGWVWGIPGALLGVPITVGLLITARHFESTRWIAVLLGSDDEDARDETAEEREHGGDELGVPAWLR